MENKSQAVQARIRLKNNSPNSSVLYLVDQGLEVCFPSAWWLWKSKILECWCWQLELIFCKRQDFFFLVQCWFYWRSFHSPPHPRIHKEVSRLNVTWIIFFFCCERSQGVRDPVAWHWFDARESNYSRYMGQEHQEAAGDNVGSS